MAHDESGAEAPQNTSDGEIDPSRLQFDLLVAVAELDRLNQSPTASDVWERARRYGARMSYGALYQNLSTLVEAGLLTKVPNPADARSSLYTPTTVGIETLRERVSRLSSPLSGASA